ncbi:MAG: hypothetical protein WCB19_06950 [Thermoplasmata archaeon]
MSPGAFGFARRLVAGAALLTGVLAIVGTPRRRKDEPRSAVDEVIGAHTESVLLTRTAPPGPRWIEVSQWDDLVKASRFMGRPILRLEDGTRSPDQPLFYVPDGPQSYVYDFQEKGVNASKSGGYVLPTAPEEPVTVESLTPLSPEPPETIEPPPAGERLLREPARRAEATTVPVPDEMPIPNDDVVEQYLGPNVREPEGAAESFDATKVEGEIREMIYHVVAVLRNLPISSDRIGPGTLHVQRAVELLRRGRYGSAQIEVNRAARLLVEDHQT